MDNTVSELMVFMVNEITDFRQGGKVKHLLSDIILTSLFTLFANGHDYQDMVIFSKPHGEKLKKYLTYPNGFPSHETYERVFSMIEPCHFVRLLSAYSQHFIECLSEKQICLDGKKLKGVCTQK
ncbi:MAG: transposase family protein [Bacteroidia bacterium]